MQATIQFHSEAEYDKAYPLLSSDLVTIRCKSVEQFLTVLLGFKPMHSYIFRGQSCSYWPIIATLFRPEFIAKPAIDSLFDGENGGRRRSEYYDLYLRWEETIVHGFANDCMDEGIRLPHIPYNQTLGLDTEAASAYFVARNYDIPNKLLDFTKSPAIAAWFAGRGITKQVSGETPDEIVVWAIRRELIELLGYAIASTSWANAQIPQMQRQKSVLIVDTRGREHFLSTGKFQPMEFMMEEYIGKYKQMMEDRSPIKRITLPKDELFELQEKLYDFELNDVRLFPTFDNVSRQTLKVFSRHARLEALWNRAGNE